MEIPELLIAKRARELRQSRRLTLQQVAVRADISKSFLSKVERGNVSISIAALSRLAYTLGVSMGEFFDSDEPESDIIYVPREERRMVAGGNTNLPYQYEVLVPKRGQRVMYPTIISIDGRKAKFELREHPGEQFILMLEGEVNYVCSNREFTLKPGDCLYFGARIPHGPKAKRDQKASYLIVHTNQTPNRRGR